MNKYDIIANAANKYNLTSLLDTVCNYYGSPDEIRRNLMKCYMYIADNALSHGLDYMCEALTTLSLIVEAIDNTTTTDKPQLIVSAKY